MASITIYKTNGNSFLALKYPIHWNVESGVLTVEYKHNEEDTSMSKIQTSLPFFIQEDDIQEQNSEDKPVEEPQE
jgi:hypothetical protein